MKRMLALLLALTALAALMVACGRNRNDADTNSQQTEMQETETQETETQETETREETETSDDGGIIDDAEDLVSDVVDGGENIVSDIMDDGSDAAGETAQSESGQNTDTTAATEETAGRNSR